MTLTCDFPEQLVTLPVESLPSGEPASEEVAMFEIDTKGAASNREVSVAAVKTLMQNSDI